MTLLLMACGSGENVTGNDAGKDAIIGDAPTFADAGSDVVAVDSGPPCTEGDFHLEVTNAAGTTVLTSGCGDASAPYAAAIDPCLDCLSLQISACGANQNLQIVAPLFPSQDPVGTWSPSSVTRVDSDGGSCHFDSTVTIYNWPDDAGGTVKGEYAAYHTGVCQGDTSLVTGRFCVERR